MVTLVVPELAPLLESPAYDACIVGLPALVPVTVTEQVPATERVHEAGVNETPPVPPLFDHVMASPVTGAPNPVRVAVQ